jgi:hypothetical protein
LMGKKRKTTIIAAVSLVSRATGRPNLFLESWLWDIDWRRDWILSDDASFLVVWLKNFDSGRKRRTTSDDRVRMRKKSTIVIIISLALGLLVLLLPAAATTTTAAAYAQESDTGVHSYAGLEIIETTDTDETFQSLEGRYRITYPLSWTLRESPYPFDSTLCPEDHDSPMEWGYHCVATLADRVWVSIDYDASDALNHPSLLDNVDAKAEGALPLTLEEYVDASLEIDEEETDYTNQEIIEQESLMVSVISSKNATGKQQVIEQLLPATIIDYTFTARNTFGEEEGSSDRRHVEMFVVDPEQNKAFHIQYIPAYDPEDPEAVGPVDTSGYPPEVRKIFRSFEIIE